MSMEFLYRYYLCYFYEDEQKALEDVLELNKEFIQPLSEKEVIRATRSAEKCYLDKNKEYKYKNDTLIELLEITEIEETYMTTIISKMEYKRRHREREKNRYLEKLKADGKIKEKDNQNNLNLSNQKNNSESKENNTDKNNNTNQNKSSEVFRNSTTNKTQNENNLKNDLIKILEVSIDKIEID